MTAALVRKCNRCQKPFLKESGCNKMTCTCGNTQCYVCSTDVVGYDHFSEEPGECPLFDDTEERDRRDVAVAQRQAVLGALATRNDVTENDLTVDENLIADIQEQGEWRERVDLAREIPAEREPEDEEPEDEEPEDEEPEDEEPEDEEPEDEEPEDEEPEDEEPEDEEWEDEERNFQEQIEWAMQEEQDVIAAIRESERMEQLRLEEEARVVAARELQRRLSEQREADRQRHLRVENERQDWEDFAWRSDVLYRSAEEEREATEPLSAGEVEVYWAEKIQGLEAFAEDARRYIAQNEAAFENGQLAAEPRERYLEAKYFLSQAEQGLMCLRKEAEIRRKEAKKRQITGIFKSAGKSPTTNKNKGLSIFRKWIRSGS
jgi:hypothetical protein